MRREVDIEFIRNALRDGWNDKRIKEAVGVPRSTYYYWKQRILDGEYDALVNRQKPGPKPRFQVNPETIQQLLSWRTRYGWGPTKMEGHLKVHYGTHIPHNRIHQLFKEEGLNKPIGQPRKTWGRKLWERAHSMTLWQVDWKDINTEWEPMVTYYDDHSRYVVASQRFPDATMENAIRLADIAMKRFGKPEQILADNGSQFANNRGESLTDFERFFTEQGIQVIHSSKQRPTTLGKLENFHGCYDAEIWVTNGDHAKFVRYWNNTRPNGAIGYKYPTEVFYSERKVSPINSG